MGRLKNPPTTSASGTPLMMTCNESTRTLSVALMSRAITSPSTRVSPSAGELMVTTGGASGRTTTFTSDDTPTLAPKSMA